MKKIIFVADIHIKLGQKNVPIGFQKNRLFMLADQINSVDHDYVVIGGDLLDVANPSIDEVGVMLSFLRRLKKGGYIIPGNHEMVNKSKDCFHELDETLKNIGFEVIRDFKTIDGVDYIPYNILKGKLPKPNSKTAITHVRGEIPPHVEPEVPLSKFSEYTRVFAGDLHSYTNSQLNILYPGSPFTTSFHRNIPSKSNGIFLIEGDTHEWIELELPQLIRKTVTSEDEIIPTDFHHTIYELEGTLEELAKVDTNKVSKKITKRPDGVATLDLSGDITEELAVYLEKVKNIPNVPEYIQIFKEILPNDKD